MESYFDMLLQTPLFSALTKEELAQVLYCLGAYRKSYEENQYIIHESDTIDDFGVVLEGDVQIINEDVFGNRSIMVNLGPGQPFGYIAASKKSTPSPVSVVADSPCVVVWLKVHKLVAPCMRSCPFHSRVIENMMCMLAERNVMMNRKLSILSQRSIRDKLLAYLAWESQNRGSNEFDIPFNREELADFLCVNRSALSREISRMMDEGTIISRGSHFILPDSPKQQDGISGNRKG